MVLSLLSLSTDQKRKINWKLKFRLKPKGNDIINAKVQTLEPSTTTPMVAPAATDSGQHEATATIITELEDSSDTTSQSDSEEKKTSSSLIELIDERIKLQNLKASHIASYASKIPSELNEDQKRSIVTLPFIQAHIKELEGMRKSIESFETKAAKESERQHAENEATQERLTQALELQGFYLQRLSTILSLIRLSAHISSAGSNKFHLSLNDSERGTIQFVIQALIGPKGSRKDEALLGLLNGEGHFQGVPYDQILLIAQTYHDSRIEEDITFANGPATFVEVQVEAESASTTETKDTENYEAKGQAEIEESKRKMAKLERDRPLWEEAARKRKEEAIRQAEIEKSKRKLAELERDREQAAQKRMHKANIEESKRKLEKLERDKPLWEAATRKRKKQELRKKEEERIRFEEEKRQATKRLYREEQEREQQAQEREQEKQEKRSQMFLITRNMRSEWTLRALLKRYMDMATHFDTTTYSTTNPLKFQSVPWPILSASFSANAIQWETIEKFFEIVQLHLPSNEYQDLVNKCHKRFHPDRWRSRRILTSVKDELEREILEEAGNTVAQALTPLWKQVTGRE